MAISIISMYILDMLQSRLIFANSQSGPLGSLRVAGELFGSKGLPARPMRVFGSYALVALTAGSGIFRDALGFSRSVAPGDAILVFPEIPHTYGPVRGTRWNELYVTFEGPIFDSMRERGVLSPTNPVANVGPGFLESLRQIVQPDSAASDPATVLRFAALLAEAFPVSTSVPTWAEFASVRLSEDLERTLDIEAVATEFGMSAAAFRKRFAREVGVPPARFRMQRRLQMAQELLHQTDWPLRRIADALGFVDEFHFSRTYRSAMGVPPSTARSNPSAP